MARKKKKKRKKLTKLLRNKLENVISAVEYFSDI